MLDAVEQALAVKRLRFRLSRLGQRGDRRGTTRAGQPRPPVLLRHAPQNRNARVAKALRPGAMVA